jgi:hypothetical protein
VEAKAALEMQEMQEVLVRELVEVREVAKVPTR